MDTNECQKHSSIWSRNVYSPCLVCRAEKAEAELIQAREEARVLAAWVRKALRQDDPDGLPFADDDIHEALERNKP